MSFSVKIISRIIRYKYKVQREYLHIELYLEQLYLIVIIKSRSSKLSCKCVCPRNYVQSQSVEHYCGAKVKVFNTIG